MSSTPFLDKTGLTYLWSKIKAAINQVDEKVTATNQEVAKKQNKITTWGDLKGE